MPREPRRFDQADGVSDAPRIQLANGEYQVNETMNGSVTFTVQYPGKSECREVTQAGADTVKALIESSRDKRTEQLTIMGEQIIYFIDQNPELLLKPEEAHGLTEN